MSAQLSPANFATEHHIFWMLVKKAARRDDVARVYLAIQSALAYKQETVDIGWLTGAMMAEGRIATDNTCESIGADGLAYFYWLYEVELTAAGEQDSHHYRFRRRSDDAQITAVLRTATFPRSLQFQQTYERHRRYLERKRAILLPAFQRTPNQGREDYP